MGEIRPAAGARISHRPAIGEAGLRRIGVGETERSDGQSLERAAIFRRRLGNDSDRPRFAGVVLSPLRDVIVLYAIDRRTAPVIALGQRLDVRDMDRRERRTAV